MNWIGKSGSTKAKDNTHSQNNYAAIVSNSICFAKQNSGAARGAEPLWKSAAADLGSSRRPWSYTAQYSAMKL